MISKIANTDFNGVEYFVQISQTKIFVSWATFPTHFLVQILGGFFQLEIFRIQKFWDFFGIFSILNTSKNLETALEWAENQNFLYTSNFLLLDMLHKIKLDPATFKKLYNKRKYTIIY